MGLWDKITSAFKMPDIQGILTEKLGDEPYLAHTIVLASTSKGIENVSIGPKFKSVSDVASDAIKGGVNSALDARHLQGAPGSIARQLPVTPTPIVLLLGGDSLSFWEFGMGEKRHNPPLLGRVARSDVASITDTGKRTARGHIRLTFHDGSFADYQSTVDPGEQFWAAADAFGGPAQETAPPA